MSAATLYLALSDFILRTPMPPGDVNIVEANAPGKVEAMIYGRQKWIDARLAKRYATPFNQGGRAVPEIVLMWLTAIVTPDVFRARGASPGQDDQLQRLDALADAARAEVLEAANSQEGLFDLPTDDSQTGTAITQGSPMAHSEASPYVWQDRQGRCGRSEDARSYAGNDEDFG